MIKLFQKRKSNANVYAKRQGGMVAILGSDIDKIKNLLIENENKYKCYIANDNSVGQIVVSGEIENLNLMSQDLKKILLKILNYQ